MTIEPDGIYLGDCLQLMERVPDKSVDMILCDPPYGITACDWDQKIPPETLFRAYDRVIKDNGAIVLTATAKFAVELIQAYKRYFRYDLVWEKTMCVGFANANRQPMRCHELILVFYKRLPTYNPQGLIPLEKPKETSRGRCKPTVYRENSLDKPYTPRFTNYPKSILRFPNGNQGNAHPTQKPLALFEYLVRTFTNPGDLVLDNCVGSGTTAVACVNAGRRFIGMEKDEGFYTAACRRVEAARREREERAN